ncbi:MAG TPA: hypothetical protein VJV22_21110 [Acidobacteriaceae bacterium]|nr:hypothetical protein [Acidobacteriaceae bacterium]
MATERTVQRRRGWKAVAPLLASLALLYLAADPRPALAWTSLVLSAAVLLLARRSIAALLLTRIAGIYLGFATVFFAVLRAFGFTVDFWWMALPAIFLAIVGVLYDLFVWQSWKGRFARARAERRGWPEQQ